MVTGMFSNKWMEYPAPEGELWWNAELVSAWMPKAAP
jgi:hypothetical protein